jgi:hypothetical protein
MTGGEVSAREMDGEDVVEVAIGHREQETVAGESRGVDEHIEWTEPRHQLFQGFPRRRIAALQGDGQSLAVGVLRRDRGRILPMSVRRNDVETVSGEGVRDGEAEPAAAAGDERPSR